jgi:hypothetical protein
MLSIPNGLPVWCPIPIDKDMLNNMKYDGGAIQRNKSMILLLPLHHKVRQDIHILGRIFSDIFTLEDTKVSQDLVPILTFLFPNCSVFIQKQKIFVENLLEKQLV